MAFESDPIAIKLNELVSRNEAYVWLSWFDELKPPDQAVIGVWELVNEVYNGGFIQYFQNSPNHAKPMASILRSIGADRAATIVETAIALAGPGTRWGDERNYLALIKTMPTETRDQLSKLESDFYDELDDLHRRVFQYLSQHRSEAEIEAPADFWTEPASP
jgi:hypothetical protein